MRICFSASSNLSERCIPGWKRSHLLRIMRQGLCSFWMVWAIFLSMAEIPASRSMTRRQMSERRMDLSVRMAEKTSTEVSIFERCLRPAVSMRVWSSFPYSYGTSTASRVVPAISETMVRSSLRMALMSDDLPAFGLPTMAIFRPVLATCSSASAIFSARSAAIGWMTFSICSMRSWNPRPCSAETGSPAPNPMREKSPSWASCSTWSALLRSRMMGCLALRSLWASSVSMWLRPSRESTTKRMRSAVSMAMSASTVTWSRNPSSSLAPIPPVSMMVQGVSVMAHGAAMRSRVTPG